MSTANSRLKIIIMGDAKNAEQAFKQAEAAASQTMSAITIATAATATAFTAMESAVISVSAEFERYNTQLTTIEGSSTKAAQSMAWITDFTKRTPFELAQVTDAFVKLKAFGIDPIANDSLRTLGDTAAAMGKPLSQGVEALADAMTGEFERLKEFGIKARTVGDQVQFAYTKNGEAMVSTADKTSSTMIESTLLGIWNDKYQGGMDNLSKTWDGMTSNMSDGWTIFQKQIGDAGAFEAAKGSLGLVMDELNSNSTATRQLAQDISGGLVDGLEVGVTAASLFAKGFVALGTVTKGVAVFIDGLALTSVQGFDLMLAGLMTVYGAASNLPGSLGKGYAEARRGIAEYRHELEGTTNAIKSTGSDALDTLGASVDDANAKFHKIDRTAVKFFTVMEKARAAGANRIDAPLITSGPADPKKEPLTKKDPVNLELAAAQKIIDIHSAKFAKIQALGQAAFGSEQERLLAKASAQDDALVAEQARIEKAAQAQGAGAEQITALRDYYDQQRIDAAQAVADQIAAVEDQAQADKLQRITDGEQAAYDLKGQFQQLVTDNQQVNLDAMQANIAKFSHAAMQWDKMTADNKLQFAAASMSALSGLMSSHNRKQFEVGKAAAQGENAINTYLGATKAYTSQIIPMDPSSVIRGALAAAAVVAAGVSNAQKINSAKMGGSTGGVSIPSVSAGGGGAAPSSLINSRSGLPQQQGAVSQQPQAAPQLRVVVNVAALDPSAVTASDMQRIADSITPHIQDAFGRGLGNVAVAA